MYNVLKYIPIYNIYLLSDYLISELKINVNMKYNLQRMVSRYCSINHFGIGILKIAIDFITSRSLV